MFWASPRPSSEAYNRNRSLWFYRWREAAGALLVIIPQLTPPAPVPQSYPRYSPTEKPEAPSAVVCCWWWAGRRPKTCWATHERQVINLWNCCTLLVELFESYDDAWTFKRHTLSCSVLGTMKSYRQFLRIIYMVHDRLLRHNVRVCKCKHSSETDK
jgi:hypothetical protein